MWSWEAFCQGSVLFNLCEFISCSQRGCRSSCQCSRGDGKGQEGLSLLLVPCIVQFQKRGGLLHHQSQEMSFEYCGWRVFFEEYLQVFGYGNSNTREAASSVPLVFDRLKTKQKKIFFWFLWKTRHRFSSSSHIMNCWDYAALVAVKEDIPTLFPFTPNTDFYLLFSLPQLPLCSQTSSGLLLSCTAACWVFWCCRLVSF